MSQDPGGVGRRSAIAIKWEALTTVLRFVLQIGVQVILARMLGPDAYGVFGMALVVITLATFLTEFGFSINLIQREDLTQEDIRLINTWQVGLGLMVALVMYLSAQAVAGYFNEPRVESVVRWLGVGAVFNAMAGTPSALMARHLNHRQRGLAGLAGYAFGYVLLGIPMAWSGMGIEALVWAWIGQSGFNWLAMTWLQRYPMRPLLWSARAPALLSVGVVAFFTNIVNWTIVNTDRILVGRYLGAHPAGVYTVSYNLANTPNALLLGSLQSVLFSANAKLQGQQGRMRAGFLKVLSVVLVLLLPVFVAGALLAPEVIGVLYGERWVEAGPVLGVLLVSMPLYVAWGISTPILWNTGHQHWEALLQLPVLVLGVGALYWASSHGLVAMALVTVVITLARCLVVTGMALRVLEIGLAEWGPLVLRAVGLTSVLTAALGAMLWGLRAAQLPAWVVAAVALAWMALLILAFLRWGHARWTGEAAWEMLANVRSKLVRV